MDWSADAPVTRSGSGHHYLPPYSPDLNPIGESSSDISVQYSYSDAGA
jgi:transposase